MMSRAQLTANLWGLLQRQFQEVGIENSDDSGNLKEPVDSTLMALGVSYGDLATGTVRDGDEHVALMVARYYGLAAVYDAALNRTDVSVSAPGVTKNRSQYVRQLEQALFRAKELAGPFLPAPSSWAIGTLSLGYIEPVCDGAS